LRSQFEELVLGDGVISSFIKGIVDAGTAILKFANTDLGQAIIMATALTAAISNLTKAYKLLANAAAAAEGVGFLTKAFQSLTAAGTAAAGATAVAGTGAAATGAAAGAAFPPILITVGAIAALTAAIYGGKKAYDYFIPSIEKTNSALNDAQQAYNDTSSDVENLTTKPKDCGWNKLEPKLPKMINKIIKVILSLAGTSEIKIEVNNKPQKIRALFLILSAKNPKNGCNNDEKICEQLKIIVAIGIDIFTCSAINGIIGFKNPVYMSFMKCAPLSHIWVFRSSLLYIIIKSSH
jgi:hypothetical protein